MEKNEIVRVVKTKKTVKKIVVIAIAILIIGIIASFAIDWLSTQSKTTKLGFEDIGELDTQVAYTTVVNEIDDPRKLFGVKIPLTRSHYIYSYDVVVKAGIDFEDIDYKVKENKIKVYMPKMHITDCYIIEDSLKIYLEDESIFSPVTLKDMSKGRQDLLKDGRKTAKANGLIELAKDNAEIMMKGFFKENPDYAEKEIVFKWEE